MPFAVGASFAVLVAEEPFATGCQLLISITSAGQLYAVRPPPYFVLNALRDEGTSYHYLPAAEFSRAGADILRCVEGAFSTLTTPVYPGSVWTTDAPFRGTERAIATMKARGLLAVEMEAAALYAFAEARCKTVLWFVHVTNQIGSIEGNFEKGEADGAVDALAVIDATARRYLGR